MVIGNWSTPAATWLQFHSFMWTDTWCLWPIIFSKDGWNHPMCSSFNVILPRSHREGHLCSFSLIWASLCLKWSDPMWFLRLSHKSQFSFLMVLSGRLLLGPSHYVVGKPQQPHGETTCRCSNKQSSWGPGWWAASTTRYGAKGHSDDFSCPANTSPGLWIIIPNEAQTKTSHSAVLVLIS